MYVIHDKKSQIVIICVDLKTVVDKTKLSYNTLYRRFKRSYIIDNNNFTIYSAHEVLKSGRVGNDKKFAKNGNNVTTGLSKQVKSDRIIDYDAYSDCQ